MGTRRRPEQGLRVAWEKVTHRLDGHSPTRARLAPTHTSVRTCTAVHSSSDLRKVPKFCRKRKGIHRHSPAGCFSGSSPSIPSHSGSAPSQLDKPWATSPLVGPWTLDPGPWTQGAGPAPHPRILSQVPSWSQRLAGLPSLAPLQGLAQVPASSALPSVPTVFTTKEEASWETPGPPAAS